MTDDLLKKLGVIVAEGELCDIMATKLNDGRPGVIKKDRSGSNAWGLGREYSSLKRLNDIKDEYRAFFPEIVERTEEKKTSNGTIIPAANVLVRLEGFYTFEEVLEAYPEGVHPLDAAWMWRRMLVALGAAHRMGLVHNATVPPHVMIHPEKHGVVLVDWCYAAKLDEEPARNVSLDYERWYGWEAHDDSTIAESTDILLAGKTMVYLLGGNPLTLDMPDAVPDQMQQFLKTCCMYNPKARPQDAWGLLRDFDELLERLGEPYHPRRFREFTMTPEKEQEGS